MINNSSTAHGKSMFSVNTNITLPQTNSSNPLLSFFHLLSPYSKQYPFLTRILFLQLVLRENVLIYSKRRVEIKQIWLGLCKKLGVIGSSIWAVDEGTKIEQIIGMKGDYKRALTYDLHRMSNQACNFLLNNELKDVSIVCVQEPNQALKVQLSDLFPLVYMDEKQDHFEDWVDQLHQSLNQKEDSFDKERFNDAISLNFSQAMQIKQQQGFLKTYLLLLKYKMSAAGIILPQSKWKKMIKIVQFIGLTKHQGTFKKLTLADCCYSAYALARNLNELEAIERLNDQTILAMLPYYGGFKFVKTLKDHFWISESKRRYYISLGEKVREISFFYPCSKYPESVSLGLQGERVFYRVIGYDKKLMSDKYIEVDVGKKYQLSLKMRNSAPLLVHLGLACFDEHKNAISPVQVCRIEGTEVLVEKIEANRVYISQNTRQNLKKWRVNQVFSYQKCIGIYQNGDLGKILNLQQVIFVENDCYSKQSEKGAYSMIGQDYIQLTEDGAALLKQSKNFIQSHHTKLMNHYQGGTYVIGRTENGYFDGWKDLNFSVGGGERKNEGHSFLIGTKYVRILLMANYNSGYPDFNVANKQGIVDFCQIEWSCM